MVTRLGARGSSRCLRMAGGMLSEFGALRRSPTSGAASGHDGSVPAVGKKCFSHDKHTFRDRSPGAHAAHGRFCGILRACASKPVGFAHLRDFFLPGFQQSAGHRRSSYPRAETAGSSPGRRPSAKNLRVPAPCGAPALRIPKSQPFLPGWDLGILSKKGGRMAGTRVFRAGITSARKRSNSHPPADVRRETDHVYAAQSLVAKVC